MRLDRQLDNLNMLVTLFHNFHLVIFLKIIDAEWKRKNNNRKLCSNGNRGNTEYIINIKHGAENDIPLSY